ncbi:hypothetical protein [Rhizobacter sp. Root1221]|uniref:hypothetical protein n=1 Tax=Rhizobacter sp. Root1221 TaxID=1736433 RepID=UPI0006F62600|nr:hypothetical protein [Rhizobacter sp. Root1221]KQV92820.1 hypothetical protein ASC87_27535 [Rhizobacter sp. Root1221]
MKNAKAVKQFFHTLVGLQGGIALFPAGINEFLFTAGYPRIYEELEHIRSDLAELGLYDLLNEAVTQSEVLAREGKYDDAEMLILEAGRKLSTASGVEDDLQRMYKSAND